MRRLSNQSEKQKKLVIFDFDGTIADTFDAAIEVLKEFAEEGKVRRFSQADIARWKNMSPRDVIKEVDFPRWKIAYLLFEARRRLKKHLHNVQLFEGVHEEIKHISQQYPCVVISSNSKSSVDSILHKYGITEFRETRGGGSLLGKYKKINQIIKKYKIIPGNAVLITDEARDIDSAKISGIQSIAVTWGYQDESVLRKHSPDILVASPDQISASVKVLLQS